VVDDGCGCGIHGRVGEGVVGGVDGGGGVDGRGGVKGRRGVHAAAEVKTVAGDETLAHGEETRREREGKEEDRVPVGDVIHLSRGQNRPYGTTEPPGTPAGGPEAVPYVEHGVVVTKQEL